VAHFISPFLEESGVGDPPLLTHLLHVISQPYLLFVFKHILLYFFLQKQYMLSANRMCYVITCYLT